MKRILLLLIVLSSLCFSQDRPYLPYVHADDPRMTTLTTIVDSLGKKITREEVLAIVDTIQRLQGEQGVPGRDGANGVDGARGLQGIQGERGLTGADGATGAQGIQGNAGTQGAKGDKGDQGNAGTNGTNGTNGSDANVTKANVEAVLTGTITTHAHTGGAVDSSIVMTQTQRGADSARAIVREGLLTGGWTEIQRSADTTLNAANLTFVNLGELSFAMAANGVYEIVARIWFTKATDASAYTLALNCGGTPTNIGLRAEGGGSATDGTDQLKTSLMTTATDSLQLTAATVGNGKLEHVQIDGQIINQNASNIFQFRWHQEIASSGVTIKRGSYLRYRRLY